MKSVWIIDGAYMIKAAPGKFDYLKVKDRLEKRNGGRFFESYYLNTTADVPNDSQDGFHTWMKSAPPVGPKMRVQLYPLKELHVNCPNCGIHFERQIQKGVDVGIATLILTLAFQNQYERLVLSAGDGDFEDAISYVKAVLHKEVWICGFSGSISADLQSYADDVIWLDENWESIKRDW